MVDDKDVWLVNGMTTLPCRKIFIKQIRNSEVIIRNSGRKSQVQEKYSIELEPGRHYSYTKVWIQGCIVDVVHCSHTNADESGNGLTITLSDGTGNIHVIVSTLVKEKNMMPERSLDKGLSRHFYVSL